ncbi:MAG: acyl-CoA dehydrogenase family protein [Parasphingopyxis sp.]|uniref:acyl-CoA dehydrogenase family protein n=1 Tax=Parasphingopyxis sp. TaxID=1920299 RepID=UPI0032EE9DB4
MAALNEEQTMLRDMARDWSNEKSPVSAFRKMRNDAPAEGYDVSAWGEQAEMGWAGIIIPEAYGGSDFGWLSLGLVLEELGRNLNASPLGASAAAASAIILGGSDAQKEAWLPKLASGEVVGTLAIDEGPHHRPDKIETSLSGGKLSGTKEFVPEGDSAGLFVVAATDGLYLVDGSDGGVSRASRTMTDHRSHAQVTFDGVAAEKLEGGGDDLTDQVLDRARAIACAEMLGMAVQAFETTLDYLKQRVQFGQVLASFQALQHRMANMFAEIELMRSSVEGALQAIDSGMGVAQAVSTAKATANDTLNLVSREMIQLHGGIGMTDEHDAGFYIKRARILENQWGNASFHRERFAQLSGY